MLTTSVSDPSSYSGHALDIQAKGCVSTKEELPIRVTLYFPLPESQEWLAMRSLLDRCWRHVEGSIATRNLVPNIIKLICNCFPSTFVRIACFPVTASWLQNPLTSCVGNGITVVSLLTNSSEVAELKINHLHHNCKIQGKIGLWKPVFSAKDLFPYLIDGTQSGNLHESVINTALEQEKQALDLWMEEEVEKRRVSSQTADLKALWISTISEYDFNKRFFDQLKHDLQAKESCHSGLLYYITLANGHENNIFHSFVVEQLPRSPGEARVFRIYQCWAGVYSLLEYLSLAYGMDLDSVTTEKELNGFISKLELIFCRHGFRNDEEVRHAIDSIFKYKCSVNPQLFCYQAEMRRFSGVTFRGIVVPYVPEQALAYCQRILQQRASEFQQTSSITMMVVDKFVEMHFSLLGSFEGKVCNYLRLLLQLFELIHSKSFEFQKVVHRMIEIMKDSLKEATTFEGITLMEIPLLNVEPDEFALACQSHLPQMSSDLNFPQVYKDVNCIYKGVATKVFDEFLKK